MKKPIVSKLDVKTLSMKALRLLATKLGISGRSRMDKQQLVKAVGKHVGKSDTSDRSGKSASRKAAAKKKRAVAKAKPARVASSRTVKPAMPPMPPAQPLPPIPPVPPFIDRGRPIPDLYGRDVFRVMPRDPEWVFLYWELTSERMNQLRSRFPDLHQKRWHLKMVEVATGEEQVNPVFLGASNWYLHVKPRTAYRAELGFMDGNLFVRVLSSNDVRTPGDTVSERGDQEWMVLRRELMRMLHLEHEKDLFAPGRPTASVERYREVSSEELLILERLSQHARKLGASGNTPRKAT